MGTKSYRAEPPAYILGPLCSAFCSSNWSNLRPSMAPRSTTKKTTKKQKWRTSEQTVESRTWTIFASMYLFVALLRDPGRVVRSKSRQKGQVKRWVHSVYRKRHNQSHQKTLKKHRRILRKANLFWSVCENQNEARTTEEAATGWGAGQPAVERDEERKKNK